MMSVVALARELHGGTNVYKSRRDCLKVLYAVEALQLTWWTSSCTDFLRRVESVDDVSTGSRKTNTKSSSASTTNTNAAAAASLPHRHPIIVVEGLDGTGKTTITRTLAERLHGVALSTPPPQFAGIREVFRYQDEAVARAFYSAANYLAAETIARQAQTSTVVVDRWWCSTCAMALANQYTVQALPPAEDKVYTWPADLLKPEASFLLSVEEEVRVRRIRKRAPEDAEERRLSEQRVMRDAAMTAFMRTKMLTVVPAPSYRAAVNTILQELLKKGISHNAVPFTEVELNTIAPF